MGFFPGALSKNTVPFTTIFPESGRSIPAIERMVVQTDWENDEAVAFLQHRFDRCGLDLQLAKAGAVNGDEIRILGFAFTYEGEDADDEYSEVNEVEEELFADSDDAKGQE